VEKYVSLLGLFVLMGIAWLMSAHRKRVSLRIVVGGVSLQFLLAILVLKTTAGHDLFRTLGRAFVYTQDFTDAGAQLVFGAAYVEHPIAFKVLPTIIFFSSLMGILYYLGIMQLLVKGLAFVMQKTLGTSGAETLSAAANVFVGQTEAPLMVRPYIKGMTDSELMAMMTGGFSTIAGGVMAAYAGMGVDPGHLMTASVISAPASLVIAKIMLPETSVPETADASIPKISLSTSNVFDAATSGASDGLKLALNVGAMLIAFTALMAMCDAIVGLIGESLGQQWSMGRALGYAFAPIAIVMGVPTAESLHVGELFGIKMVANEFLAYAKMSEWSQPDSGVVLSERSRVILTYSLAGFSNFASIGIQIGGIGGLVPERRQDLAKYGFRAMIGGTLACFMTACIAGVLL